MFALFEIFSFRIENRSLLSFGINFSTKEPFSALTYILMLQKGPGHNGLQCSAVPFSST